MNPSRPFILRPVATSLLMAGILLAGLVAYRQLPVSALPEVDYPTIQVLTFYPGASPDVMASSVTSPLERQFGQVPGLNQMTSISSFGSSVITLQFVLNLNIDVAEQEVQAVDQRGFHVPADRPAQSANLQQDQSRRRPDPDARADFDDSFRCLKVEDFADTRLAQKISQVSGRRTGQHQRRAEAGGARSGQSDGARLLWAEPGGPAHAPSRRPTSTRPRETSTARGRPTRSAPTTSCCRAQHYRPLIVAYRNGAPVRLSDVARRDRRRRECASRRPG